MKGIPESQIIWEEFGLLQRLQALEGGAPATPDSSVSAGVFLRLDASNDPITGDLTLSEKLYVSDLTAKRVLFAGAAGLISDAAAFTYDAGVLSVSPDVDTTHFLGRAKVGSMGTADRAGFAHYDMATSANRALEQTALGVTYLNCASGKSIEFQIAGTSWWKINSSGYLEALTNAGRIKSKNAEDLSIRLGDNSGTYKLIIEQLDGTDMVTIDSNGKITSNHGTTGFVHNLITNGSASYSFTTSTTLAGQVKQYGATHATLPNRFQAGSVLSGTVALIANNIDRLTIVPAGDISLIMGDAAGVKSLIFQSSTPATIGAIDSLGNCNMAVAYKVAGTKVVGAQALHEANAKADYAAGDLDTEAEIITAFNNANTTINNLLAKLETHGLLASA